jgi:hypothetical protein
MSRDVGRFRSTGKATALPALPHLQPVELPGVTAISPTHLASQAPGEGGRPCNEPAIQAAAQWR